jgi:hypothetical protein
MVKLPLRNKSVGTKVTEAEFAALEVQAQTRKLTLSEWVRSELLKRHDGRSEAADEVLLGEVLALRTILINLLFSLGKRESLTPEDLRGLIERADADKTRRALERLGSVRTAKPDVESVVEVEIGEGA